VNLSDEKASACTIQSSHAIDIFAFVEAREIPFSCLDTPYYLAPVPGDERVYTLLQETLNRTGKIGIAHVMIRARRRLAALIPCGPVLMLNTLRMSDEGSASLIVQGPLRKRTKSGKPTEKEVAVASRVVESMTQKWDTTSALDVRRSLQPSADFLRPSVRLSTERLVNVEFTHVELATGYQSQRDSRPRARARRTYQ
jgi:DNA end-binding protein Ku